MFDLLDHFEASLCSNAGSAACLSTVSVIW